MRLFRHIITAVSIVASFIAHAGEQPAASAKNAASWPIGAELQLLQGTWEGFMVGEKVTPQKRDFQKTSERKPNETGFEFLKNGVFGSPQEPREKVTITITGNLLHFHRDKNFWFETTFTLPVGTDPKQLHATIKACAPGQESSVGKVVVAIFKIEDGTLTLIAIGGGTEETPKSFEDTEDKGLSRYELRKVQPRKGNTEPPATKRTVAVKIHAPLLSMSRM